MMADRDPTPIEALAVLLRQAAELLRKADRNKAAQELQSQLTALLDPRTTVAFIGPFKSGKGSLINSLLNVNICPVDADETTRTVVSLSHGAQPRMRYRESNASEPSFAEVADLSTVDWGLDARLDVLLPRALLELGITLIDLPGIPGAGSSEHQRSIAVASRCDAVIWVASAGRELTASDISVIDSLRSVCPQVIMALAKSDLYTDTEAIQRRNQRLLSNLDGDRPVPVTSAALRRAGLGRKDARLDEMSGVPDLVHLIAERLLPSSHRLRSERIASQATTTLSKERWRLDRAEQVLRDPSEAETRLRMAQEHLQRVRTTGARWRTDLKEVFNDAANLAAVDLKGRFGGVLRAIEEELDESDPRRVWGEVETRLQQLLRQAIIENHSVVEQKVIESASAAADRFDAELSDIDELVGIEAAQEALSSAEREVSVELGRGSVVDLGMNTIRGAYMPGVLFSALASAVGLGATVFTGGLIAVAAAALGGRAFLAERERQLRIQRQQAKTAVRRHVEETSAIARQALQKGISDVRGAVADRFVEFTTELESSASDALFDARRAAQTDQVERARSLTDVQARRHQLAEVAGAIRETVTASSQ